MPLFWSSWTAHRESDGLSSELFHADWNRLRRFLVRQRRGGVRFRGMLQRYFRMMLATVVVTLAAMLCRGAMALGGVLVFLRSRSVRFNYMVFFVHMNAPDK